MSQETGEDLDGELVARAQIDPSVFALLYDRYFAQIYRFVFSRVHDQTIAEDLTADVFLKALVNLPRYRHTGHPFSAWLYQIASNTITDRHRSNRRRGPTEDISELRDMRAAGPLPDEDVAQRDELRRIWGIVETLPESQRTALALKFHADLKIEQIATIMDKSPGAVKLLVHRGMETLKSRLNTPGMRPDGESTGPKRD